MHATKGLLATATCAALCAAAAAQGGYRTFESEQHGFRLRVPRFVDEQPLEPMEEQILAKFMGRRKGRFEGRTREMELMLLVVRIQKVEAPVTGKAEAEAEAEEAMVSLKEQERARLNGGTTIEEFLKRREWVHQKRMQNSLRRPVKSKDGRTFDVFEVSSNRDATLAVRAFTLEDDREIFGLFALGAGAVEAFHSQIVTAAKSLECTDVAAPADAGAEPSAGALADPDRRRRARESLPEGWTAHDTEHFILVTNVRSRTTIKNVLTDLEIMRVAYTARFPPLGAMDQVSTVRICGSYEDYMRYGAPAGTGGYWHPLDEELVLFDPGKRIPKQRAWLKQVKPEEVLYHEAMHQYLHYANGQVPPASWFNEGYGEVFGGAEVSRRKGEVTGIEKNRMRMKWVKVMQRQGAWPDLRILLKMTQDEFYGPSSLQNYAMGWAFCYFLEQQRAADEADRRADWAAIPDRYLQNLRTATQKRLQKMPADAPRDWLLAWQDEIQAEAFEATFGAMDLVELEAAWIEAMKRY